MTRQAANNPAPIIVMPTVTKNDITVLFNNAASANARLQLFDTAGRLIAAKAMQTGTQTVTFELRDYPAGLYLLRYQSETEIYSVKVVKQ